MVRRYNSFLLQCRRFDGGQGKIDIEHIQSGDRVQVDTLAAALAWIEARAREPADGSAHADKADT